MEVEAKLRAPRGTILDAIAARRRLAGHALRPVGERELETVYLDTRRRDLSRAGIAFRIRRAPEGVELTIKLPGEVTGAVHRRREITWTQRRMPELPFLPRRRALVARLAPWTANRPLQPLVGTRIRRRALVAVGQRGETPLAEIDLDEVRFFAPGAGGDTRTSRRSYEVEVELLGGGERDLERLAEALRRGYDLRPVTGSKLARALRWAGLELPRSTRARR